MRFKGRPYVQYNDRRIVERVLFFPKTLPYNSDDGLQTRWLLRERIQQRCFGFGLTGRPCWENLTWTDDDEG